MARRWAARLEDSPTLAHDPFARIAAAHHWVRAGNASRAFDATLAAAELAGRIMALDEEARLLREAWSCGRGCRTPRSAAGTPVTTCCGPC